MPGPPHTTLRVLSTLISAGLVRAPDPPVALVCCWHLSLHYTQTTSWLKWLFLRLKETEAIMTEERIDIDKNMWDQSKFLGDHNLVFSSFWILFILCFSQEDSNILPGCQIQWMAWLAIRLFWMLRNSCRNTERGKSPRAPRRRRCEKKFNF